MLAPRDWKGHSYFACLGFIFQQLSILVKIELVLRICSGQEMKRTGAISSTVH